MKKKQAANFVMVAIIAIIVAVGVLIVGMVHGWFDRADGTQAVLTEIRGIVNIERDGVSYALEEDTVLRANDRIICSPGATVKIRTADGSFILANSAEIKITDPASDSFAAKVGAGEVFVNTATTAKLTFAGQTVEFTDTASFLSVRSGAQTVSVFAGNVGEAQAGQTLDWINGETSVGTLAIQSLNDFAIAQLRAVNETMTLYFTNADLDQLEADRWAEKQEQLMGTNPTAPDNTEPSTEATVPSTEATEHSTETTQPSTTTPPATTDPPVTQPPTTDPPATNPPTTELPATEPPETETTASEYDGYCTISIRCDTILDNWDKLDPAKAGYVPSNGIILPTVTVGFYKGETVFDVLSRVCDAYSIQLEYSWTPLYGSYYIEGINHLYEFDCGSQSGWNYKVNGWFPNYGCSSYELEGDETIVWCYTCVGLGADVGGGNW